jgi:hypothetical protein
MVNQEKIEITHLIPLDKLGVLKLKIAKLNKTAGKLKLPPITISYGSRTKKMIKTDFGDIGVSFIEVTVLGEYPRLPGYQFLAKLKRVGDRNLILGTKDEINLEWVSLKNFCDHCKSHRARKETYLIKKDETGAILQVGSNCIDQFIGSQSLDAIAMRASIFEMFDDHELFEPRESGSGGDKIIFTEDFIAAAIAAGRSFGYVSKSQSEGSMTLRSTAIRAFDKFIQVMSEEDRLEFVISDSDREMARMAMSNIDLVLGDMSSSQLGTNIKTLTLSPDLHFDNINTAALLGRAALLHGGFDVLTKRIEKPQQVPGQFLGAVGDKIVTKVKVHKRMSFDSSFNDGTVNMIIMKDESGNTLVTTTGGSFSPEIDSVIDIKATVKAHKEYKGTFQTILSRVSIKKCETLEKLKESLRDRTFMMSLQPAEGDSPAQYKGEIREEIEAATKVAGIESSYSDLYSVLGKVSDFTQRSQSISSIGST